jgi:flavin-dependent dehydrogenase
MPEVLVIGGGLAGAGLATHLAIAGRQVRVLERETGPRDKVCGDFLSHEAMRYLRRLRVDTQTLGAAPITRMRLSRGPRLAETALPFGAASVSRRVLDEAVLDGAARAGATVSRGARVTGLRPSEGRSWTATLSDGEVIQTQTVFLATGKHDLHGHARGRGGHDDLVAFKSHFRLAEAQRRALSGAVELFLFSGGYAGLSLIEDGRANLCLLVRRERLSQLGARWDRLLPALLAESEHLRARLQGSVAQEERALALSAIPYGYSASTHPDPPSPGLWRLGDQAAVIPSFSGDGMSIALHSAELAAAMFLRGERHDAYHRALARDLRGSMRLALPLSRVLVHPVSQRVGMRLAGWMPRMMTEIARHTRIPELALRRAGESQSSGATIGVPG